MYIQTYVMYSMLWLGKATEPEPTPSRFRAKSLYAAQRITLLVLEKAYLSTNLCSRMYASMCVCVAA